MNIVMERVPIPLSVVAYNMRSLWNVGSLFRTCDAFAIEHLYLTGYTGVPPRKEIEKTAIGAEKSVPWSYEKDPHQLIAKLTKEDVRIIALESTKESEPLHGYARKERACIILGNELLGIPESLLSLADDVLHIPMHGVKESLNVSVAAGIALHQLSIAMHILYGKDH